MLVCKVMKQKKKADKNKKELSIQYLKTWDMRYDKNIL